MHITRREAVIKMAVLMGAIAIGPRLLAGKFGAVADVPVGFTAAQLTLLDEIADTIIPPTNVPGAKAAEVGAFIAMMVHDCYEPDDQAAVHSGLAQLDADYAAMHHQPFAAGREADRTTFLSELDRARPRYFRILKELTLLGYFTSEIGCNQALQYAEVPGRYDGNVPYRPGDRAWAPTIK